MRYLWKLAVAMLTLAVCAPRPNAQYFRFGKNKVHYESHEWFFVQSKHFDVFYYEPGGKYLAEFTAEQLKMLTPRVIRELRTPDL